MTELEEWQIVSQNQHLMSCDPLFSFNLLVNLVAFVNEYNINYLLD